LEAHNLQPLDLKAKEGLCLINGTQLITALGAEAVERSEWVARQADVVAAFTLDVLKGSSRAFDSGTSTHPRSSILFFSSFLLLSFLS
jgi:histidine ammonia-lyase